MAKGKWDPIFTPLPLIILLLFIFPKLGAITLIVWTSNYFSKKIKGRDLSKYSSLRPSKELALSFSYGEFEVLYKGRSPPKGNPYWLLFPKKRISEIPKLSTIYEEPGIFYGLFEDGSPLVLNRFSSPPHSEIVLGKTGSGKTLFSKAVSLRYVKYLGSKVYVIDPLGDYSREVDRGVFLPFSYPEILKEMKRRRNGIILIDEGWKELRENKEMISELFRICRHYGWGVTLITQDPKDLRGSEELIRNSKYLFLFNLPSIPEWFERALGISGIREEISKLSPGEAFLIFRGKWKFRSYLGDLNEIVRSV